MNEQTTRKIGDRVVVVEDGRRSQVGTLAALTPDGMIARVEWGTSPAGGWSTVPAADLDTPRDDDVRPTNN